MQDIINRLRAKKQDEGFTLIELLVVVVIIGVLVAIAVPVYLNYRQGAADKSAQSDVRGAVSAIEQWYTDNGNTYPASTAVQTASFSLAGGSGAASQITLSDNTSMMYVLVPGGAGTSGSYRVCATNSGGTGKVYIYNSAQGGSVKAATTANAAVANCATLT
ncbi:type II secretion system protein [Jidongwangia harbinensis]|uniref:type II secretion system protein n=1 Tax=Jidongwangia harbinensis TaxID=2878561 RepID=UPI001CD9766D|nr:prepilin-type N-terminal cleavage/methylation domain-containing protein [Jidongwangia harbinensis]MCA2215352.1 prepilin-type N-terminal cleavage/methylation domain-containing protein [Jidongwangia harbinensis]